MKIEIAQRKDIIELVNLLGEMYADNGLHLPEPNWIKVYKHAARLIDDGVVFTAKGDDGKIVGSLGLEIVPYWFADDLILADLWFFVRPSNRATRAAMGLLKTARQYADANQMPIRLSVFNGIDVERKDKLFERAGFPRVGGVYLRGA